MRRQLLPALRMVLVFTVLTGVIYPALVFGFGRLFASKADGSHVRDASGTVVGSSLIGQQFQSDQYFHSRPSAAGFLASGSMPSSDQAGDPLASGASNLGPTNPELVSRVGDAIAAYRAINGLTEDAEIPVDAVTSSGSGVDPHISVANARLQALRVAAARGLAVDDVLEKIDAHTDLPALGFLGTTMVNVLALNLALDGS